jgi:hypothetical protein
LTDILRDLDAAKARVIKLQRELDDEVENRTALEAAHSQLAERL